MSYLQAIVIALVQGVTELFPVSSLGHSVLVPAWIGGTWSARRGSARVGGRTAQRVATARASDLPIRPMVAGLVRGLGHEDPARFAFVLATPVALGVLITAPTAPV
jgi:undecaprenyl pyrophosphate phosphatase UppP